MADDLDLGEEKKSSKKMLLLIVVGVVAIAVGATLYFTGFFDEPTEPEMEQAENSADDNSTAASTNSDQTPLYANLDPTFIVNFPKNQHAKLLQLSLSVLSYEQDIIDALEKHKPMLRNNLLLLLSAQDPAKLTQAEGKNLLRDAILEAINKLLDETERLRGIENVFFTAFVMQ